MTETNERCVSHPAVAAVCSCDQCGNSICRLCAFSVGRRELCPSCIASGGDPDVHKRAAQHARWAIVLAAISSLGFLSVFTMGAAGVSDGSEQVLDGLIGMIMVFCPLAGITFALMGREHARRTGSPLATIGVVANAVLLGLAGVLSVIGTVSK